MQKMEIILVYLGISSLLNGLSRHTYGTFGKKEIISSKCKNKKGYNKCFCDHFYMYTIITKLIDMNLRDDKKTEDQNQKDGIDSKTKPEHRKKVSG